MCCFCALTHFHISFFPNTKHIIHSIKPTSNIIANHTQISLMLPQYILGKWAEFETFSKHQPGCFWVLESCRRVRSRISMTASWFIFRLFTFFCLPPLAFFIYFRSGMRPLGGSFTSALLFFVSVIVSIRGHAVAPHDAVSSRSRPLSLCGCVDLRRTSRLSPCVLIISHLVSSPLHSAQLRFLPPSVALSETITRLFLSLLPTSCSSRPDTPHICSPPTPSALSPPSAPPICAWPNAGRGNLRPQLDSAMQDVSDLYLLMEETEKQAVRRALLEERGRYCTFINMLQPVVVRNIKSSHSK